MKVNISIQLNFNCFLLDIDRNTKLLGPENNMESNEEYQEIETFEISEDPNVVEDDWTQFLTVCFDFHHLVSEVGI